MGRLDNAPGIYRLSAVGVRSTAAGSMADLRQPTMIISLRTPLSRHAPRCAGHGRCEEVGVQGVHPVFVGEGERAAWVGEGSSGAVRHDVEPAEVRIASPAPMPAPASPAGSPAPTS